MSAKLLKAGDVAVRSREFRSSFATALAIASVFICVANVVGIVAAGIRVNTAFFPGVGVFLSLGSLQLIRVGRVRLGTNILLVSDSLLLTTSALAGGIPALRPVGLELYMLIVVIGTLFEGFAGGAGFLVLCSVGAAIAPIMTGGEAVVLVVGMQACAMITGWLSGGYAERYFSANERMLAERVQEMEAVVEDAERVAEGDLSIGEDTSPVMRRMLEGLRRLVEQSLQSVHALASATAQMSTMSRKQTTSASSQAEAVTETRATIASLDASTETISESAGAVLDNARAALEAHHAARDHTNLLVAQEERAGEFLEMIKEVARRSEIIALNAALEGSHAGEAGRGFSLVAVEIQRLAASTSENVSQVKAIIEDIRGATAATAETIGSATALAESTTDKARKIASVARQQASATHQVLTAIEDIAALTHSFSETSDETLAAMDDLTILATELEQAVATFRL
jgi:Methyl-accepting chemotaxis protein (MCP) signalling domain